MESEIENYPIESIEIEKKPISEKRRKHLEKARDAKKMKALNRKVNNISEQITPVIKKMEEKHELDDDEPEIKPNYYYYVGASIIILGGAYYLLYGRKNDDDTKTNYLLPALANIEKLKKQLNEIKEQKTVKIDEPIKQDINLTQPEPAKTIFFVNDNPQPNKFNFPTLT